MSYSLHVFGLTRQRLDEEDVLNGDIEALISPYLTANLWVSRSVPFIWFRPSADTPKSGVGFSPSYPRAFGSPKEFLECITSDSVEGIADT